MTCFNYLKSERSDLVLLDLCSATSDDAEDLIELRMRIKVDEIRKDAIVLLEQIQKSDVDCFRRCSRNYGNVLDCLFDDRQRDVWRDEILLQGCLDRRSSTNSRLTIVRSSLLGFLFAIGFATGLLAWHQMTSRKR